MLGYLVSKSELGGIDMELVLSLHYGVGFVSRK
ncbi:hypothetical protein DET53_101357 [Vibrio parahaemolyticus]|nr:hypothetical protein DET53_101357 [Vibrio parahaemolyticus]